MSTFSREECDALAQRVFGMIPSGTKAEVRIYGGVGASTRFARGDTDRSGDGRGAGVSVSLSADDRRGGASTTRIDEEGLRRVVAEADATSREWRGKPEPADMMGAQNYKTAPKVYFEKNLPLMTPDGRASLVTAALDATDAAGLIGAGTIALSRSSIATVNTEGLFTYLLTTSTEFSLTARTKDGTGSGWAWSGYEDWSRVDTKAVIARAVDLAVRSKNPVAVEPGRYTVILEPAAVAQLLAIDWSAWSADQGGTVFSKEPRGTNKIGLQMMDRRLNMVSDPWDPEAPQSTADQWGYPLDRVQWFERGILINLMYHPSYAKQHNRPTTMGPGNLRLYGEGQTQTLDEMIAGTKRGVWVNRFSNITSMNDRTMLMSGTTRDGTFLIENGRVTKSIKNFRFTESPFFVLNKLEAFGEPVRAFGPVVAPRLKVRDFDFTSLTDAV